MPLLSRKPTLSGLRRQRLSRSYLIGGPAERLVMAMAAMLAVNSWTWADAHQEVAWVAARPHAPECYRFFGDREVKVPLLIYTHQLEGLELSAQLVQLSSRLSAPLGQSLQVPLPDPPASEPRIEADLALTLPEVRSVTDFEVRIRGRRKPDQRWSSAGGVRLKVYPDDLLASLRDWAESNPLRVQDDQGQLVKFLRDRKIPFSSWESRSIVSEDRGITLCAGSKALRDRRSMPSRDGERIVLFTESEVPVPHLSVERCHGTILTVEMRLLDRLATDPLSQQLFVELFRLFLQEEP